MVLNTITLTLFVEYHGKASHKGHPNIKISIIACLSSTKQALPSSYHQKVTCSRKGMYEIIAQLALENSLAHYFK